MKNALLQKMWCIDSVPTEDMALSYVRLLGWVFVCVSAVPQFHSHEIRKTQQKIFVITTYNSHSIIYRNINGRKKRDLNNNYAICDRTTYVYE